MTEDPALSGLLLELERGWVHLADKPEETPQSNLAALTACAAGDRELLLSLLRRRMAGVPLAHLTGRQRFMGIEFLAGPEALIPRKETEILCRGALELLNRMAAARRPRVLDLCCGSGNVGLALAKLERHCDVWLADISEEALGLARKNSVFLQLDKRTQFITSDLFSAFNPTNLQDGFDLITCNPPYISSGKVEHMHPEAALEPRLAFDGGPFGVKVVMRLIRETPSYLTPSSWLAFEVGAGQGIPLVKMLSNSPSYRTVNTLSDESGEVRAITARTAP